MNHLLRHLEFVKICIYNVIIHSNNAENHGLHVNPVLEIFKANKVFINFEKSRFFKTQICYLGHIIDKNKSIANFEISTT